MNPHHLHFDHYEWREAILVIPIMFAVFPFPAVMPLVLIAEAIDRPDLRPLTVGYFIWGLIGLFFIYLNERDSPAPGWAMAIFPDPNPPKPSIMTQEKEVFDAIVKLLQNHEFKMNSRGDMVRQNTGCQFSADSLRKYKTVVDFQLDYPYYA